MGMKKHIKHMNDFVLGILMVAFGLFLVFGKITQMEVQTGQGGFFARSDIWLRGMAALLIFVSVVLIIRSINFKKADEVEGFKFYLDSTVVATVIALILYAVALPKLGFIISSLVITFYLVFLYSVKENNWKVTSLPQGQLVKLLVKSVITSVVMLAVLWVVFGKLLAIQLPTFALFG